MEIFRNLNLNVAGFPRNGGLAQWGDGDSDQVRLFFGYLIISDQFNVYIHIIKNCCLINTQQNADQYQDNHIPDLVLGYPRISIQ